MPIVDVTGLTAAEISQMKAIRKAVQQAFLRRWNFEDLEDTTVNFLIDPSIKTSPYVHVMARIYTKKFIEMTDKERDEICKEMYLLLEKHGGHVFNEAFAPGYNSMCGGWKWKEANRE